MSKLNAWRPLLIALVGLGIAALGSIPAAAGTITVKTVPWVATNPLIPHDTWNGATITLKGTADQQERSGNHVTYIWDFGDGSTASGTVSNQYIIEAQHVYTGAIGTIYTARLSVTNQATGDTGSQVTYIAVRAKTLDVEVNRAIDEGLWYEHKQLSRYVDGYGQPAGDWTGAFYGFYGGQASVLQAFEVNGHLESGASSNPYVEDVQRGMRVLFTELTTGYIGSSKSTSGTGYGVAPNQGNQLYQGGMFMDAIVASGTPNAIAPTGPSASGSNPGIVGRTYKAIVWDMLDYYYYCQYPNYGGWRYSCGDWPDNSASQWGAIGILAANRNWGIPIPSALVSQNLNWLNYSQNPSVGWFGYTDSNPIWGPYGTTGSGMVQLAMDSVGRGSPQWDKAETFMRDNWTDPHGYGLPVNTYYYAAFAFTKSMLLHQPPITMLHSQSPGVPDLDWYKAQVSQGDPADGEARFLVNGQQSDGHWCCHSNHVYQYPFETPWALIMLNRTLFEAGQPVAVAKATPNPALAGQNVSLDGSQSYQQDQSKQIVKWEWDINNDGVYELTGPTVTTSFPSLANYPVTLRVTDNGSPAKTATTTITVLVSIPPIAPTANAGGPYTFCPGKKWFLDGTRSVNPDNGKSEPGAPPDYIKQYAWDLFGHNSFGDAFGVTPDVTGKWGPGSYLIQLKVTDNTAASFPSSGLGDLSSTASSQVVVKPSCSCISDLTALAKNRLVQLNWTSTQADHYNVYRSTVSGGPYTYIATVPGNTTSRLGLLDKTVTNNVTYYYVVRDANLAGDEYCQSNEVKAKPVSLF
jgi:hypothetical protein